jgi:hypothetical protein
VVTTDSTLKIFADTINFAGWEKIEFYNMSQKIGEVLSGQEPVFYYQPPNKGVYSFLVLGIKDGGATVRTSYPARMIVKQGTLVSRIPQKVNPKKNPVVSRTDENLNLKTDNICLETGTVKNINGRKIANFRWEKNGENHWEANFSFLEKGSIYFIDTGCGEIVKVLW